MVGWGAFLFLLSPAVVFAGVFWRVGHLRCVFIHSVCFGLFCFILFVLLFCFCYILFCVSTLRLIYFIFIFVILRGDVALFYSSVEYNVRFIL